jgi:hypothetical protein
MHPALHSGDRDGRRLHRQRAHRPGRPCRAEGPADRRAGARARGRRGAAALRVARPVPGAYGHGCDRAARRDHPGRERRRPFCGAPPIATIAAGSAPTSSTSRASPSATSPSAKGSTIASAPRWRACRAASSSRRRCAPCRVTASTARWSASPRTTRAAWRDSRSRPPDRYTITTSTPSSDSKSRSRVISGRSCAAAVAAINASAVARRRRPLRRASAKRRP